MSRFRRLLRWGLLAFLGVAVLGALGLGFLYFLIAPKLPDVDQLRTVELQEPLYVYSRDGRLMALFGETRRYPIDIEKVPTRLKQAFIAIEDSRFYEHHGVDYKGVARAVWLLATTNDKRVPGGSTITQQVARQFFLSSEYSYTRKLAEMMLAMRMENELTKDEIFELYLNKSFFGNRAYGVAAAAEFYYGKTVDQLTLDEMASLASIPKFPSSGNPITNPERAKSRRDYVLQRMRELNFISAAEEQAAVAAPMHAAPHERPIEVYAPYVAEMVRQEMVARFGGDVLTKGYHVTTTIDPVLQTAADQAIRDGLETYDHRHGWHGPEKQVELQPGETDASLLAHMRGMVTQGGLVPAIVTGTEGSNASVLLADGTHLDLGPSATAWTTKSPGALLKRGDIVRVRRDMPQAPPAKDGEAPKPVADAEPKWTVDQLPRAQSALVSLEADTGALRALAGGFSFAGNKFNRATQARRQPGSSFKPFLYAAAFERGFNPASIVLDAPVVFKEKPPTACRGCSMQTVNGKSVPASNVVAGFDLSSGGADADTGVKRETTASPRAVTATLPADAVAAPRAIDERVAYQLVSMMRDVVQRGTGTAAKVLGREDVGGKTGSTNDHRDAWFSGFGGNLVTTVWVGRDDFRSLGYREYGGKAALPIWIDYMRVALKDQPIASNDPPEGMVKVAVSAGGQLLPTTASGGGVTEYVKAEDLERMESYVDYGRDQTSQDEAAFDIF